MRLMADVGTLLSSSLDSEAVLRQLTTLVVPTIADWCTIDVLDQAGNVVRLSAHHSDPEKLPPILELERRYPGTSPARDGVARVLRTGQTDWQATVPETLLRSVARDAEHLRIIESLGVASYLIVPLSARGRILGALSLVYASSGRYYTPEDVTFVEELAARAALSVDNARLFEEQVEARQRLERQARQALLVGDVGAALTRSTRLGEGLQRCAEALIERLGASLAGIWTRDSRGAGLELRASARREDLAGATLDAHSLHADIERLAQSGDAVFANDVGSDPALRDRPWVRAAGASAFAGYPLIIGGQVIGVMALVAPRTVAVDTLTALASIADTIAIGIERARAEQRALDERDTLEAVNEVGRALAAELDREKLVQLITDSATRLAGAAFGAFFYNVVDAAGESYTLYTISGVPKEAFSRFPMPRNTKVFAPTFAGESTVRVHDIRKDPRYGQNPPYSGMPAGHLPVASYLAVPVVSRGGTVIGGLFFGHPEPGVFSERSEMLVAGLAAQAAVAMDNARLFREAQKLIAQLDESNKELDQFAYVTSHDLKAPLRGISTVSQWLEEDLGDVLTDTTREQLGLLRSRVQRMEGLINGILAYSRAGRMRSKPELVAADKLLAEVIEMSAGPPGARVEVAADMPALRSERVPLQQVFLNLIGNAFKHSRRADPHVRVAWRDDGQDFRFSVTDDGPGIAPEFHERIWGIFQTLEPRDSIEGTGIGLSIVKKIVESKGGRVWVESREGAGATFHFTWPKAERNVGGDVGNV
jgi:GAF domain-containing protein/two-component sensor histidine kinase